MKKYERCSVEFSDLLLELEKEDLITHSRVLRPVPPNLMVPLDIMESRSRERKEVGHSELI